jgi:hypothetical protein
MEQAAVLTEELGAQSILHSTADRCPAMAAILKLPNTV